MKEFDALLEIIALFEGIVIIESALAPEPCITFTSQSPPTIITSFVSEIEDSYSVKLLAFPSYENQQQITYQLTFDGEEEKRKVAIVILTKMLKSLLEAGNATRAKQQEFGLPDLTFITARQMAGELKNRENLCFALVWIENNERDNIAIEGSGNPTQLIGLLARGLHMAIEWADKNIKFHKPGPE